MPETTGHPLGRPNSEAESRASLLPMRLCSHLWGSLRRWPSPGSVSPITTSTCPKVRSRQLYHCALSPGARRGLSPDSTSLLPGNMSMSKAAWPMGPLLPEKMGLFTAGFWGCPQGKHGWELTTGHFNPDHSQCSPDGPHELICQGPQTRRPRGQTGVALNSPWRWAAGRPPVRAGCAAGRVPRSQGGCTHRVPGVGPRPRGSPAPCSAGCSGSQSTPWSPGRCQRCCPLGRTKVGLSRTLLNATPTALHPRTRWRICTVSSARQGLGGGPRLPTNIFMCN